MMVTPSASGREERRGSSWLIASAGFALFWIVARAVIQSITIDEADGWSFYAARPEPSHWEASSVNHLMNSLLMRLFIGLFGLHPVTVRMPSLLGAVLYIAAAYWLVRFLSDDLLVQLPLFFCLVYNPFVMDHLVVGRGYSLGTGCLMAAIAVAMAASRDDGVSPYRACGWCSVLVGFSFLAQFSFAVADAAVLGAIVLWFWNRGGLRYRAGLLAAAILPGLLLTLFFAGSILADSRHISLAWGAKSLRETLASVIEHSLYEPNPYLLSPPVYRFFIAANWLLLPLLAVACLMYAIVVWRNRAIWRDNPMRKWCAAWALSAAGIVVATLGIHRLMYRLGHILMPLGRRAVFLAPLCFLTIGALLALNILPRWRLPALTMLWVTAFYFVCCLRLSYFKEWKYNADAKELYAATARCMRANQVSTVAVNWRYAAVLNFYRVLSGDEDLPEFVGEPDAPVAVYPRDRQLYILFYAFDSPFIIQEGLKEVYHSNVTDATVALRPAATPPAY